MFGRKNKDRDQKLQALDDRLTQNSKLIEEDHHDLVELKAAFRRLVNRHEALCRKFDALYERMR